MKLKCLKQYQKRISNLLLIFIMISFSGCKKGVEHKIGSYIENHNNDTISISHFTDFEWDELWIVGTSEHREVISIMNERGVNTGNLTSLRTCSESSYAAYFPSMVFIHNRKIIYYCSLPLKRGGTIEQYVQFEFKFPRDATLVVLPKEEAIFFNRGRSLIPVSNYQIIKK